MTEPTLPAELVKAIPVVVGGLLAILGGVGGHFVTHWLMRSRDRTNLRRERLETLVKAIYQYKRWVNEKSDVLIFREGDHDAPSPLDEANMIQELYFPELAYEILAVEKAFIPLLKIVTAHRIHRMKNKEEFITQYDPKSFDEAYEIHLIAIRALLNKCKSLATA